MCIFNTTSQPNIFTFARAVTSHPAKVAIWSVTRKVLKGGKLPFWRGREHGLQAPATENPALRVQVPSLPPEIWGTILGYTVRMAGSRATDLGCPFETPYHDEEFPDIDSVLTDRRSLARVCSTFRTLVAEIFSEYLVIHRGEDLEYFVQLFKRSHAEGLRLGERTLRIDFKITGPYNPKRIRTLLKYTPNLLILVNQNNSGKGVLGRVPKDLIKALMLYGTKIRRLHFDSIHEAPALFDLIDISRYLQQLNTLRLLCIHSYPRDQETVQHLPIAHFRSVKILSLAMIPRPSDSVVPAGYVLVWDPFLQYLSLNVKQLPLLERFETAILPFHSASFFQTHGAKLHMLRTTSWSAEDLLPEALDRCPNLESLVLEHSTQVPNLSVEHPTLKRICITPMIEETVNVPPHVFKYAVLDPLDQLIKVVESMSLRSLTELRIRDVGAFVGLVEQPIFLQTWWRRWNLRGVNFVDKDGKTYDNPVDPEEILLNQIRA